MNCIFGNDIVVVELPGIPQFIPFERKHRGARRFSFTSRCDLLFKLRDCGGLIDIESEACPREVSDSDPN